MERNLFLTIALALASSAAFADRRVDDPSKWTQERFSVEKHVWLLHDHRHWQIEAQSSDVEEPEKTDATEGNRGSCPFPGMVEIKGKMRVPKRRGIFDEVQLAQDMACSHWINREPEARKRCGTFDKEEWEKRVRNFPTRQMHFCIDRYEFPNRK